MRTTKRSSPSQPPDKTLPETPSNVSVSMGKHESLDEDVAVEEDMRRMAVALGLHSRDPHSIGDTLLSPASCEIPDMERNRAMRDDWSCIPRQCQYLYAANILETVDRTGRSGAY